MTTMMTSFRPGAEPPAQGLIPKIETNEETNTYGRFIIEPLEAGFGTTLGNALRRVLLGSLPGAAITAVKIDQVQHEFSSIPHVREDTVEFLLNVKKIRLHAYADNRPGRLILDKTGPGVITAADIEVPADFEIVNKDLYLATLDSPDARLSIEFKVEHGKGYVPANSQQDGHTIGVIPVDAIFTPIRKVNYVVEHARIGGITNYDRLIIELWTDGTIQPYQAIMKAANLLVDLLKRLTSAAGGPGGGATSAKREPVLPPDLYNIPIEELDLSVRTYNALKRGQITKVGQVVELSDDDLLAVRNFGQKSLTELRERLIARGFMTGEVPSAGDDEDADDDESDVELDMFGNPIRDDMDDDE